MTEHLVSQAFVARRQAWLSQLRTSCDVLSEQPRHLVKSISVTQRFAGVPADERRQLLMLATRLAGEYRLKAETTDSGTSITVWFTRPASGSIADAPRLAEGSASGGGMPSLIARVLRRVRLGRKAPKGDRSAAEKASNDTEAKTQGEAW